MTKTEAETYSSIKKYPGNISEQGFISHGIKSAEGEDGKVHVYLNYPIALESGGLIQIVGQEEGRQTSFPVSVETSIERVASAGGFSRLIFTKHSNPDEIKLTADPNIIMNGQAVLLEQVVSIDYGMKKDAETPELGWSMPPLEGEIYLTSVGEDGQMITSVVSGAESAVPGGGFHFIKRKYYRNEADSEQNRFWASPLDSQLPRGGVLQYIREETSEGENLVYEGVPLALREKAVLVLWPAFSSDKEGQVLIAEPFVPTFKPSVREDFTVKAKVLSVFYASPEAVVLAGEDLSSAHDFYKYIFDSVDRNVKTAHSLFNILFPRLTIEQMEEFKGLLEKEAFIQQGTKDYLTEELGRELADILIESFTFEDESTGEKRFDTGLLVYSPDVLKQRLSSDLMSAIDKQKPDREILQLFIKEILEIPQKKYFEFKKYTIKHSDFLKDCLSRHEKRNLYLAFARDLHVEDFEEKDINFVYSQLHKFVSSQKQNFWDNPDNPNDHIYIYSYASWVNYLAQEMPAEAHLYNNFQTFWRVRQTMAFSYNLEEQRECVVNFFKAFDRYRLVDGGDISDFSQLLGSLEANRDDIHKLNFILSLTLDFPNGDNKKERFEFYMDKFDKIDFFGADEWLKLKSDLLASNDNDKLATLKKYSDLFFEKAALFYPDDILVVYDLATNKFKGNPEKPFSLLSEIFGSVDKMEFKKAQDIYREDQIKNWAVGSLLNYFSQEGVSRRKIEKAANEFSSLSDRQKQVYGSYLLMQYDFSKDPQMLEIADGLFSAVDGFSEENVSFPTGWTIEVISKIKDEMPAGSYGKFKRIVLDVYRLEDQLFLESFFSAISDIEDFDLDQLLLQLDALVATAKHCDKMGLHPIQIRVRALLAHPEADKTEFWERLESVAETDTGIYEIKFFERTTVMKENLSQNELEMVSDARNRLKTTDLPKMVVENLVDMLISKVRLDRIEGKKGIDLEEHLVALGQLSSPDDSLRLAAKEKLAAFLAKEVSSGSSQTTESLKKLATLLLVPELDSLEIWTQLQQLEKQRSLGQPIARDEYINSVDNTFQRLVPKIKRAKNSKLTPEQNTAINHLITSLGYSASWLDSYHIFSYSVTPKDRLELLLWAMDTPGFEEFPQGIPGIYGLFELYSLDQTESQRKFKELVINTYGDYESNDYLDVYKFIRIGKTLWGES